MPTFTFTATGRKRGDVLDLRVELADGRTLTRTVTWAKVNSPAKLAAWLIEQQPDDGEADPNLQRAFTVTFHTVDSTDAQGRPVAEKVLDSVTPAALPDDAAWATLTASQLGTITLADALTAVDGATTVAQLRAVVRALVQVVIPMRDVVDRLLTGLRRAGLR